MFGKCEVVGLLNGDGRRESKKTVERMKRKRKMEQRKRKEKEGEIKKVVKREGKRENFGIVKEKMNKLKKNNDIC